jgi:hypothetical protein
MDSLGLGWSGVAARLLLYGALKDWRERTRSRAEDA